MEKYSPIGDDQLREYTDFEELGSSQLSLVFGATEQATRRKVVLRVLLVDNASPVIRDVVDREVVGLGALWSHPNVVTLLRSTTSKDGRPVLVFERCKGTVARRLGEEALSSEDTTSLGIKIAGALECSHRQGTLHRDVKPENILLTEFGEPALGDFGMARLEAASQFATGALGIRTSHTPPEVLEGRPPTTASDVYALGSTMYELLAGRTPFRSDDLEPTAVVMTRILRDDPPPLPSSVPQNLAEAIYGALAKDPAQRPPDALAFAGQLLGIEEANGWALTWPVGVDAKLPPRAGDVVQTVAAEPVDEEPEISPSTIAPVTIAPVTIAPITQVLEAVVENVEPVVPPVPQFEPAPAPAVDVESSIWGPPEMRHDTEPPAASVDCPNGHQMPSNARFCGICGATIASVEEETLDPGIGTPTDPRAATTMLPAQPNVVCGNGHPAPVGSEPKPFCRVCGAPMLTECEEGHQMPAVAAFCPVCGHRPLKAPA